MNEYKILRVGTPFHISALRARKPRKRRRLSRWWAWRALTPQQEVAILAAMRGGAEATALAAQYDVSLRTIYRTAWRGSREHVVVAVAGWKATFVLTEEGPLQATPWVPA